MGNPRCNDCKLTVTPVQNPGISCVACEKFFHFKCADISKESQEDFRAKRKTKWTCSKCKRHSTVILPPVDEELNTTDLKDFLAEFTAFKKWVVEKFDKLEQQGRVEFSEVLSLKEVVRSVEFKAEELEKIAVERTLEVQGVPEDELTDPVNAALAIGQQLHCLITEEDVECSVDKIGLKPVLAISFHNKATRSAFLTAGKTFNKSGKLLKFGRRESKAFVNEKLTADQKRLLYNTRTFAARHSFKYSWFVNGQVHLKRNDKSQPIVIRSQISLDRLQQHESSGLLSEREGTEIEDERSIRSHQKQ